MAPARVDIRSKHPEKRSVTLVKNEFLFCEGFCPFSLLFEVVKINFGFMFWPCQFLYLKVLKVSKKSVAASVGTPLVSRHHFITLDLIPPIHSCHAFKKRIHDRV